MFRRRISSIVISRAIYGLNWYTVSPLYLIIASELAISYGDLGLVSYSFIAGAALFQIPAGIIASRIGSKNTAIAGMILLSFSSILSGLAWDFYSLISFRFMLGIGAAMFFSPAAQLMRLLFNRKRHGLAIGLYNAAFNIGAGIAVAIWGIIATYLNWRLALIIGGILGLIAALDNYLALPKDIPSTKRKISNVFKNKLVINIAIGTAGFWGSNFALTQFIDSYIIAFSRSDYFIAGIISSITLFGAIIGNLFIGSFSDKLNGRKTLLFKLTLLYSIITALTTFNNETTFWLYVIAQGILSGGIFSIFYASISESKDIEDELMPLAFATVNSVNIGIGSFASPIYTYATEFFSPLIGWILLAIYGFLPLLVLIKLKF